MRVDARLCRLESVIGRRHVAASSPVEAFDHAEYLRLFEAATRDMDNAAVIEMLLDAVRPVLAEVQRG